MMNPDYCILYYIFLLNISIIVFWISCEYCTTTYSLLFFLCFLGILFQIHNWLFFCTDKRIVSNYSYDDGRGSLFLISTLVTW